MNLSSSMQAEAIVDREAPAPIYWPTTRAYLVRRMQGFIDDMDLAKKDALMWKESSTRLENELRSIKDRVKELEEAARVRDAMSLTCTKAAIKGAANE